MTVHRGRARPDQHGTATVAARSGRALMLRAREIRGALSLTAAAERIGIRPDELGRIERGETRQVRWETLLGMAQAYGVEVGDLLVTAAVSSQSPPAYAGVLAALRSGALQPVIPHRFAGDPDVVQVERGDLNAVRADATADFTEPAPTADVRRSGFRPASR